MIRCALSTDTVTATAADTEQHVAAPQETQKMSLPL